MRVGYWQAPNLLYWWIDGHVSLNEAQAARLRQDIDRFMAWHRTDELPRYIDRLRHWQSLADNDLTADTVCEQAEALTQHWARLGEQGSPALAALALELDDAQIAHLARHQRKQQERFAKEFLRGTTEERLQRRLERTADRYEDLYGTLTPAQLARVKAGLAASPFNPEAALVDRQLRDERLIGRIRQWQALPAGEARQARAAQETAVWLRWTLPSSREADAPMAHVLRHGCEQFAALHNSTDAKQRAHARRVLQGYEADLRALLRQD